MSSVLIANRAVSTGVLRLLGLCWVLSFLALWSLTSFDVLPTPGQVLLAFAPLFSRQALMPHLLSSLEANLTALFIATALSLGLAYASVLPVVRPLAELVSKIRFWGFAGVTVVFTLLFPTGHDLKIALLVFGITGFFVTAMCDEVLAIPSERFDHARALGMSAWRVTWEVVVLGTLDRAFDVFRQNAAMGWMLLTAVETLVRSEGGVGVMLATQNKHMDLAGVAALQAVIFGVGIAQDYAIGVFKNLVCPHAALRVAGR
jgi:NitT/TauT family transport system permease protein